MAERTLHNHLLQNQTPQGGFGHRQVLCDEVGAWGLGKETRESTWCCTYHGELGFDNLRDHLLSRTAGTLSFAFALDFTATDAAGTTVSSLRGGLRVGEVLRQRISLAGQPATVVRVRQPHWADGVTAVDPEGKVLESEARDGWCATKRLVTEVEFVYTGGVYAEDRRCTRLRDGPEKGNPYVIGYGPKIMAAEGRTGAAPGWPTTIAALKASGYEPFATTMRGKDCRFVVIPAVSLRGGRKSTRGKATNFMSKLSSLTLTALPLAPPRAAEATAPAGDDRRKLAQGEAGGRGGQGLGRVVRPVFSVHPPVRERQGALLHQSGPQASHSG
jgi:hypothetical protein